MTKEEFKEARKQLKLTQSELGDELGISNRSVQGYEYGNQKIPKAISILLSQRLLKAFPETDKKRIEMDVRDRDKLSLEEIAHFCIKHKEKFVKIPEIEMLIEYERKDAEAKLMEQHIILRNNENMGKR